MTLCASGIPRGAHITPVKKEPVMRPGTQPLRNMTLEVFFYGLGRFPF